MLERQQRIMERLIEQSKCTTQHQHYEKEKYSRVPYEFEVCIDIGDGRSGSIFMNQNSNPFQEAELFCSHYGLEPYIVELLGQSLREQNQTERNLVKQNKLLESTKHVTNTKQQLIGADRIFKQNRVHKKQQKIEEQQTFKPKINKISEEIVKKAGKNNIMESIARKSHDKLKKILHEQLEEQEKKLEHYSFHPNVNPISQKVDLTLKLNKSQEVNRFQQLYHNYQNIQSKKQKKRKSAILEIPFKPEINGVSRRIVSRKKSLGGQAAGISFSTSKDHSTSVGKLNQSLNCLPRKKSNSKKSLKPQNRNQNNIPIGEYLYKEALKQNEKHIKAKKEAQIIFSKNSWKIIEESDQITQQNRSDRIREVFYSLTKPPHQYLYFQDIEGKSLTEVEKLFEPVYREMKDMNTELTEQQFTDACLRLLKYLTPAEKSILLKKQTAQNKQNTQGDLIGINRKSQELLRERPDYIQNIYIRGIMYRKETKDHIEKQMQEKVRKQLKDCTFKPKINQHYSKYI